MLSGSEGNRCKVADERRDSTLSMLKPTKPRLSVRCHFLDPKLMVDNLPPKVSRLSLAKHRIESGILQITWL